MTEAGVAPGAWGRAAPHSPGLLAWHLPDGLPVPVSASSGSPATAFEGIRLLRCPLGISGEHLEVIKDKELVIWSLGNNMTLKINKYRKL